MRNCWRSAASIFDCSNCNTPRWRTAIAWSRADVRIVRRFGMRSAGVRAAATVRAALLILASLLLAGCYAGYLARAAYEGGRILWNRKPIADELAQQDLSKETREK